MELEVVSLTTTPSELPEKFLIVLATICSARLEVLVSEGGVLPPGNTMIPLSWKLRLPPNSFGLLMPLNQQAQKGVWVLAGVTNPAYQGEIELLFYSGGKDECVCNTEDTLGNLLLLPCPVIKVGEKLQPLNPGRTTNSTDSLGMNV